MIQIAIMGLGTVGTGVAKVVAENAKQIERKLGEPLQVKTILVRRFKDGPYRQLMTDRALPFTPRAADPHPAAESGIR